MERPRRSGPTASIGNFSLLRSSTAHTLAGIVKGTSSRRQGILAGDHMAYHNAWGDPRHGVTTALSRSKGLGVRGEQIGNDLLLFRRYMRDDFSVSFFARDVA
jgi:hypothetical protein